MTTKIRLALLVAGVSTLAFTTRLQAAPPKFSDVQPIFERSCYACHGEKQQMGQLRLDVREAAWKGGQSGAAIVPGDAAASGLYGRIAGLTDQARMPMGGEPLPTDQVALVKEWIDAGADWPEDAGAKSAEIEKHWAFVKPERPTLPTVRDEQWPANAIDRFVLAKLDAEGLTPSPEAGRAALLRRLSLDLIGLPPSIEEVDAFLADESPDAWRKQIDRLLASPHYGERWGRHWLDAARYADSDGFEKDKPREVWFYRDWVVNALNRDMPYDQFIIEQVAGDLLPNRTQDQLVATGFLRNSMINEEGGADPEQFRMEAMFDRMDAIGTAMLGLTIKCAQCHNHKFDPLTQEDYYRMFAFLNNSHESNVSVYTPAEQAKRAGLFGEIRAIEDELIHRTPGWRERMAAWEESVRGDQPEWTTITPENTAPTGAKYVYLEDGSILTYGYAPTRHDVRMSTTTNVRGIRAFRLELMMDPRLPLGGPGRSIFGTSALTELEVEAAPASDPEKRKKLKFVRATADVNPPLSELDLFLFPDKQNKRRILGEVDFAIDGFEMSAWSTDDGPGRRNQPRKAVFNLAEPIEYDEDVILTFHFVQKHGGYNSDDNQNNNLGRFRVSVTTEEDAVADPLPARAREMFSVPSADRTPQQEREVFGYWRTTVDEWKEANARIELLLDQHPEGSAQLVLHEREGMRETHRLARGDFLSPKEKVEPGTPRFLQALDVKGTPTRLDFARWMASDEAPTTARAIVNRIWQSYFGTGLVETSEDLGTRAAKPSHREVLDWLAVELMDNGWSRKHVHRLIAASKTYRQSSRASEELIEKDPANRLLARGPRFRVEGEIVRDIALASSGLLYPKVGGPPVFPPAPEFLFQPPVSYGPKRWYVEQDEDRYRRALYTFRFRSVPYPVLDTFDTPNGDAACVRRARSNTPLQALATLNETVFIEAARALAAKTLDAGGASDAERLSYAFRRCLTRTPDKAESDELLALLARQRERFAAGELDPKEIAQGDAELASWTVVSRVLLNLDETITKQ